MSYIQSTYNIPDMSAVFNKHYFLRLYFFYSVSTTQWPLLALKYVEYFLSSRRWACLFPLLGFHSPHLVSWFVSSSDFSLCSNFIFLVRLLSPPYLKLNFQPCKTPVCSLHPHLLNELVTVMHNFTIFSLNLLKDGNVR